MTTVSDTSKQANATGVTSGVRCSAGPSATCGPRPPSHPEYGVSAVQDSDLPDGICSTTTILTPGHRGILSTDVALRGSKRLPPRRTTITSANERRSMI